MLLASSLVLLFLSCPLFLSWFLLCSLCCCWCLSVGTVSYFQELCRCVPYTYPYCMYTDDCSSRGILVYWIYMVYDMMMMMVYRYMVYHHIYSTLYCCTGIIYVIDYINPPADCFSHHPLTQPNTYMCACRGAVLSTIIFDDERTTPTTNPTANERTEEREGTEDGAKESRRYPYLLMEHCFES